MWDGCLRFSVILRPVVNTVEFEVEKCEIEISASAPKPIVIGVASNRLIPVIAFAIYFCGLMC